MSPIRIYTTTYCGFCRRAKQYLLKRGLGFEEIDVTHDFTLRDWLAGETGQRTVPQIFVGKAAIGGFTELVELDRRGGLDPLLQEGPERDD